MTTTSSQMDDEELFHLAIRASKENRHEDAISLLKKAVAQAPNNAKAIYMLGAEHAEIGMYDRAVIEIAKAVQVDPSLTSAHFQHGLLHITSGRVNEAELAWKPLDQLGENNPFFLFKKGMLHLARDEFDACRQALENGIKLNTVNEALNVDMRRILEKVTTAQQINTPAAATDKTAKNNSPAKPSTHVLVSTYRQNRDENDKE